MGQHGQLGNACGPRCLDHNGNIIGAPPIDFGVNKAGMLFKILFAQF